MAQRQRPAPVPEPGLSSPQPSATKQKNLTDREENKEKTTARESKP